MINQETHAPDLPTTINLDLAVSLGSSGFAKRHRGEPAAFPMNRNHCRQIQVHDRVAIQNEKWFACKVASQWKQRTARAPQNWLWQIRYCEAQLMTRAKRFFDLPGKMV